MSDFCLVCLTEAVDLEGWFTKTEPAHGKTAIIECICPWCAKDAIQARVKKELDYARKHMTNDEKLKGNAEWLKKH
jgi:hypothetical protein